MMGLKPFFELPAVWPPATMSDRSRARIRLSARNDDLRRRRCAAPVLDDGGLADAGLANKYRIVFGAAAQDLNYTFEFTFTAHRRIQLAVPGGLGQSARELAQ